MNKSIENLYVYYRNIDINFHKSDFFIHSHDYFEIYMFHKGDCKYLINDHVIQLHENDIIVMNGSALHGPTPTEGQPYERTVIEFSPEWMRSIINQLNVPEILTPFDQLGNILLRDINVQQFEEIHSLLQKINIKQLNLENSAKKSIEKRMLKGEITTLLIELLFILYALSKSKLTSMPVGNTNKMKHVNKVITWIDYHYSQNLTLDEISDHLHISKYYMSRIFKDITGITVMQYMMQRRLLRSKYLLEMHPEKSILDIALESGFESASHFSRKFRKHYQFTPTEYRNRDDDDKPSNTLINHFS
ncbi:AraC family transcriptional regulator [Gracilibacillus orientalis]|nr:AraC family transcriptional regulator [Gracilibacillus orientalis]